MTCFGNASANRVAGRILTISDDIIYELVLYTKYHYSKAPSPGVNDCFVFFGIDLHSDIGTTSREIYDLNRILQFRPQRALLMTRLILEMDILMTEC